MSFSYARLRQLHLRNHVGERLRGMTRTTIVVLAFFGGFGLMAIAGLIVVLARGLMVLTCPHAEPLERLGVLLGWQCVTLGLLWSLRSAIFMREAEPFLAALPIPERTIWRTDMLIAAQCYSVLWLPLIWLAYVLWDRWPPMQALLASTSYLVMIGVGMALNMLLLRGTYRHAVVMLLPMLVLLATPPQSVTGTSILLGTAACSIAVAVRQRPTRRQRIQPARRSRGGYERLVMASALVVPVSLHVLRESLVIRGVCLLGAWALAMTLVAGHRSDTHLATALLIGLPAMASAALCRLPALMRSTVLEQLDFLSGHRRFRRRVTLVTSASPMLLFAACLLGSWVTAQHVLPGGMSDAMLPHYPLYLYAGLFLLGAVGAHWTRDTLRWLMPTAHFGLTLILLMVALT